MVKGDFVHVGVTEWGDNEVGMYLTHPYGVTGEQSVSHLRTLNTVERDLGG